MEGGAAAVMSAFLTKNGKGLGVLAFLLSLLLLLPNSVLADAAPKRGGVLEFAVTVEPMIATATHPLLFFIQLPPIIRHC